MDNYYIENDSSNNKYNTVLIIYDISDNKRRMKFSNYLQGFGHRVQKSAFEAKLSSKNYHKLVSGIQKFFAAGDNIRVYKISNNPSQFRVWGNYYFEDIEDVVLV